MAKTTVSKKGKYLSKQDYIEATLTIIHDIGVGKLSMRRVADQLGVSAMAPYKHFTNKDELLSEALDALIARSEVFPDDDLPWDQWVMFVGKGMYKALCGETSWLPYLGSFQVGPQGIAVTQSFVKKLSAAGFSTHDAVEAYFSVLQVVTGAVSMQSTLHSLTGTNLQKVVDNFEKYAGDLGEHELELANTMIEVSQRQQIDIGLPLVIEALRARLEG